MLNEYHISNLRLTDIRFDGLNTIIDVFRPFGSSKLRHFTKFSVNGGQISMAGIGVMLAAMPSLKDVVLIDLYPQEQESIDSVTYEKILELHLIELESMSVFNRSPFPYQALARILSTSNHLHTLVLSNIGMIDKDFIDFIDTAHVYNESFIPRLQKLDLSFNGIVSDAAIDKLLLVNWGSTVGIRLTRICKLNLCGNSFSFAAIQKVCEVLAFLEIDNGREIELCIDADIRFS